MSTPGLVFTIDETRASASVAAALLATPTSVLGSLTFAFVPSSSGSDARARVVQACARRGLAVALDPTTMVVAHRSVALVAEPAIATVVARMREHRVELSQAGRVSVGEPVELLAAAPLLEAFERGVGLRWALLSVIEGRDSWSASVDLYEREPERLDLGLQKWFPNLVGRIGYSAAIGPQLGSALHASVLLGTGASVDGVRDLLAAQAEDARSRFTKLVARPGSGSADCLGQAGLHLDLAAIASAGPLVRLAGYFDPAAVLADDLVRRLGHR